MTILEEKRLELIKLINDYSRLVREDVTSKDLSRIQQLELRVKQLENTWNAWVKLGLVDIQKEQGK